MGLPELANLARIGKLKAEPRNAQEVDRLLALSHTRLQDAALAHLSLEGRFTSAYSAAHAAALAAMRWHGYRSDNRYMVFQCLWHTLGWPPHHWRVLDAAHRQRNLAEYEGFVEVQESTVAELCDLVSILLADVQALVSQPT